MKLSEYVSADEVKRVCRELDIRDWTTLREPKVLPEEAHVILAELNTGEMKISLENFRQGLEVELEHGIRLLEANVTKNNSILTGQIVLAHFKESLDYYKRLEVTEIEATYWKPLSTMSPRK